MSGEVLMEEVGKVCVEEVIWCWDFCNMVILCGLGNNGGDGFVIVWYLKCVGWFVFVFLFGKVESFMGDVVVMVECWDELI